jgi:Ca-activated chloride channel family protein
MAHRTLRMTGVGVLSLAVVSSSVSPSLALPAPGAISDGAVTPEACAALGFQAEQPGEDIRVTGVRKRTPGKAGQPMYEMRAQAVAPPPPLPIPPVASRTRSPALNYAAPPIISGAPPVPRGLPPQQDTERYPGAVANPVKRVAEEPVSTFSIDVDTASLRQRPPLPERRAAPAKGRRAGRGADQLFRLRLRPPDLAERRSAPRSPSRPRRGRRNADRPHRPAGL